MVWCGVRASLHWRWLVLSLDAALLHGLHSLSRGYWPVVATLLDKASLSTITSLRYATKPLARGTVRLTFSCGKWHILPHIIKVCPIFFPGLATVHPHRQNPS